MIKHLKSIEIKNYLQKHQPILLDVRQPWEFDICHIENSVLLPMVELTKRLHKLDKFKEYVLICHYGVRSFYVAKYLDKQGFKRLINLSDGIDGWAKKVDSSMKTY